MTVGTVMDGAPDVMRLRLRWGTDPQDLWSAKREGEHLVTVLPVVL